MARTAEPKKQIALSLSLADWLAVRQEAAQQGIPITELCRRWFEPELAQLRRPKQDQPRRD